MLIHQANRDKIESILLGQQRRFQEEQLAVINSTHSTNIIACPGSGKTTVLIAKIALLLEKLSKESSKEGLCIITHTNVAVEEIIKSLEKLGINDVGYPHFIGTIHEFFNTFFSIKAYGLFTKQETYSILDKEEYEKCFLEFLKRHNHTGLSPDSIGFIDKIEIKINKNDELIMISRRENPYHTKFLNTIKDLFNVGFLRPSDTLALANWYIHKYKGEIQRAFIHRFSYVFIDEAQDTSVEQYENLNMLIPSSDGPIVQWFGDPYQALYSLYGKEDAWLPHLDQGLQINYSNRFGETIAKILRTTCIEEYDQLKVNEGLPSAAPHIFIFNNQNKSQLIQVFADTVETFRNASLLNDISGKVVAVCQHKFPIYDYSSSYEANSSKKPLESIMQLGLRYCHRSIIEGLRMNDNNKNNEERQYTKNTAQFLSIHYPELYRSLKVLWAKLILDVWQRNKLSEIILEIKKKYHELIEEMLPEIFFEINLSCVDTLRSHLVRFIEKAKNDSVESDLSSSLLNYGVELNTIHGVKGETHFATLMLESNGTNGTNQSDLKSIFNFLIGNHQPQMIENPNIKDILKLAYVALSRPRYFIGIAMHEDNLSDLEVNAAKSHGWKIVKLSDISKVSIN